MSENNQKTENPLLTKIAIPGETFRIPSGGLFYEEGILDQTVKNGELHVYPMTAHDEILLKTPDKLFSGDAVREVFSRCIPQVLHPGRLFAKDVDYLLVCLRKVSYGEELQLEYTHDCKDAKQHTYIVDVTQFIKGSKSIDPTTAAANNTLDLENGQQVVIQPLRFDNYVELMQLIENDSGSDIERMQQITIQSLQNIVHSVDGYTDKNMIREWLENIPPKYTKMISERIDQTLEWGPDFTVQVTCKDCEQTIDVTAPLNPLVFFT